jgi:membrane protein DedA with SNARE-associated domain/membrane-associated phospholipid phosphatase
MSDIVSPLLQWLNANPEWAGFVTFAISAGESVAILGTLVPGSITMTAIGTLAGAGVIPLGGTIFWAILGAIVGDSISYWIGHYFKERIRYIWPFRNTPSILNRGEYYVHKYGVMSVFIGRFVGPVRALVPVVAGMLGMKPLHFTIANITSAIGWAPIYMLPGILLGAASLELPPEIAVHAIIVLFLMVLFIVLCVWIVYKLFQLIQTQTNQLQHWIWQKLKQSRYLSPVTILLRHHHPKKVYGQLSLALLFFITLSLFFVLIYYVKTNGADHIMANNVVFHLFRGLRTKTLDTIMINITLLGQKQVILPIIAVIFGWLIIYRRWRAAFHVLLLGILAGGSIFISKHLIQSPRPWGIFQSPESYSMPSGHATLTITIIMGLAFLIANAARPFWRHLIYYIAVTLTFFVGISRLYLGAHWLTDILAAWLLGSTLLTLVIISYQRYAEKPISSLVTFFLSLFTLTCTFLVFHHIAMDKLKISYAQINWPILEVPMKDWLQQYDILPAYRTSLFGFQSQAINIEWVGNIDKIEQTLSLDGWKKPPSRDLISTLHRIADISSTQYLPLVSPQYLDKKPALILTKQAKDGKSLLVIRLWNGNRVIKETKTTIWVGIVGIIPRSYSWLFKKNSEMIDIDIAQIFPILTQGHHWTSQTIFIDHVLRNQHKSSQRNILLIWPHYLSTIKK